MCNGVYMLLAFDEIPCCIKHLLEQGQKVLMADSRGTLVDPCGTRAIAYCTVYGA